LSSIQWRRGGRPGGEKALGEVEDGRSAAPFLIFLVIPGEEGEGEKNSLMAFSASLKVLLHLGEV